MNSIIVSVVPLILILGYNYTLLPFFRQSLEQLVGCNIINLLSFKSLKMGDFRGFGKMANLGVSSLPW